MSALQLVRPEDFFRTKISQAANELRFELDQDIEFYLVNLMCDFISFEKQTSESINLFETPLALAYQTALEAEPNTQLKIYKKLGDTSLYIAGYFSDYFNLKTYDASYYTAMGAVAYRKTARLVKQSHGGNEFARVYNSLADQFEDLVAVVTEFSIDLLPNDSSDLLATFEKWHKTGSKRLLDILKKEGIYPHKAYSKKVN